MFIPDPKWKMELDVGSGGEMLGSPCELSLLPGVLDLFCESTQQDNPIAKHWFALAHVYHTTNQEYSMVLHENTVLWVSFYHVCGQLEDTLF